MEIPAYRELRDSMDHLAVTSWEMQPHISIMDIMLFSNLSDPLPATPCDLFMHVLPHMKTKVFFFLFYEETTELCKRQMYLVIVER